MRKSRRATIIWLVMIGLMLGVVFLSGAVSAQIQLIGLAAYILTALAATGFFSLDELRRRLPKPRREAYNPGRSRRRRVQASSAAEKAQQRARSLSDYEERFVLADIGLIVSEVRADGLHLRRGQVSLDDQGVQPYIVIDADPSWTNETTQVLFEILDQTGQVIFRHAEEVYLREGQNNILSSHRLPLGERAPADVKPGMWELRVSAANAVIGLHTFGVGPSLAARRRLISDMERRTSRLTDSDGPQGGDDSPISLEDLLRGQQ